MDSESGQVPVLKTPSAHYLQAIESRRARLWGTPSNTPSQPFDIGHEFYSIHVWEAAMRKREQHSTARNRARTRDALASTSDSYQMVEDVEEELIRAFEGSVSIRRKAVLIAWFAAGIVTLALVIGGLAGAVQYALYAWYSSVHGTSRSELFETLVPPITFLTSFAYISLVTHNTVTVWGQFQTLPIAPRVNAGTLYLYLVLMPRLLITNVWPDIDFDILHEAWKLERELFVERRAQAHLHFGVTDNEQYKEIMRTSSMQSISHKMFRFGSPVKPFSTAGAPQLVFFTCHFIFVGLCGFVFLPTVYFWREQGKFLAAWTDQSLPIRMCNIGAGILAVHNLSYVSYAIQFAIDALRQSVETLAARPSTFLLAVTPLAPEPTPPTQSTPKFYPVGDHVALKNWLMTMFGVQSDLEVLSGATGSGISLFVLITVLITSTFCLYSIASPAWVYEYSWWLSMIMVAECNILVVGIAFAAYRVHAAQLSAIEALKRDRLALMATFSHPEDWVLGVYPSATLARGLDSAGGEASSDKRALLAAISQVIEHWTSHQYSIGFKVNGVFLNQKTLGLVATLAAAVVPAVVQGILRKQKAD